jgi:hypothetical protein
LDGVLPPQVFLKVFAQHHALCEIAESLWGGAIFSPWIRVFGRDGPLVFALESAPTILGYFRHPFPPAYGGYRVRFWSVPKFAFGDFDYTFWALRQPSA